MSAPALGDGVEWKYRSIIGELAALLAHERQPELSGDELIAAATEIVNGVYDRFGLPGVGATHRVATATDTKGKER